jgi:hypothetical protein
MYNQTVYGSIGYATGAALGAFKALREKKKKTGNKHHHNNRCILVTGEGSLHLTVQAFADLLKLSLNPIVFVLNNDGYTVERLIHGRDAAYNKLPDVSERKSISISIPSMIQNRTIRMLTIVIIFVVGLLETRARFRAQLPVQIPRADRYPGSARCPARRCCFWCCWGVPARGAETWVSRCSAAVEACYGGSGGI